jgi:ATP-dependent DNA helicase RecG
VFPSIERVPLQSGRELVVVSVERGVRRPYVYRGQAYRRVGTTNRQLSREEYNQMLLEQLHSTVRWESEPAFGWRIADLDTSEIVRTLEEAIRRGRAEDPGTRDSLEILRGLGLVRGDHLLRAAVVLFARSDRLLPDYPQCLLRVARFKGVDKTEFLDNRQFTGNAFDLLVCADRFLRGNLPIAGRVVPNLFERVDDPLYPPMALREAVANAICHRDYAIGGGSIGLAIYDDRLEITSSGTLHFGLTTADLYRPHESLLWNPLIAAVFYRRGIIEAWGRGTLKMAELTEQAGLPRPEFEEMAGVLVVRFRPSRYLPPQRIGHNLTQRQQDVLQLLGTGSGLALGEIHMALGQTVTLRALRDDLDFLKRLGMINSIGHGRGAKWILKEGGPSTGSG